RGLGARLGQSIPVFVIGFLVVALLNTVGAIAWLGGLLHRDLAHDLQVASRFLILVALSGVGLSTRLSAMRRIGATPFLVGLATAAGAPDHRVTAGALPVDVVQVEPHPELIECQRQTHAVEDRRAGETCFVGAEEEQVGADRGQDEDPVVQMVNVGLPKAQIKVVESPYAHQDAGASGEREGDDEPDEDAPGQARDAHVLLFGRNLLGPGIPLGSAHGPMLADNSVEIDATHQPPGGTVSSMSTATMNQAAGLRTEAMWSAFERGDRRYDGRFVTAVRPTGTFCRPSCTCRKPRRENVLFYASPAHASRAGYRPCKRCRPELRGGPAEADRAMA